MTTVVDLVLAMKYRRTVRVTDLFEKTVHVNIQGIDLEDGSGDRWLIRCLVQATNEQVTIFWDEMHHHEHMFRVL